MNTAEDTPWRTNTSFGDRVASLAEGTGIPALRAAGPALTVFDDAIDRLTGDAGTDWFLFNSAGGAHLDLVTDMSAFEGVFDEDL